LDNESPQTVLYDLFLLGLAWLRQAGTTRLELRGASIFACLQYAGFGQAKALALDSWDLADLVCERSVVHAGNKNPKKRELQKLIDESDKHNVILAVPSAGLTPALLFGPSGYSHAITAAGLAHAASVEDRYAGIITKDAFLRGWELHRTRMATYNAKQNAADAAERGE